MTANHVFCENCIFYVGERYTIPQPIGYTDEVGTFHFCHFERVIKSYNTPVHKFEVEVWADPFIKNVNNNCSDFKAK